MIDRRTDRRPRLVSTAILLAVLASALPLGVFLTHAGETPVCTMGCANTANCCCVPTRARAATDGAPHLEPATMRGESCPANCATPVRASWQTASVAHAGRTPAAVVAARSVERITLADPTSVTAALLTTSGPRAPPC